MNVLETESLHYSFGRKKVLHGINLEVPEGSIYGFLGPNGSGKTTTIRILLGLAKSREASVRLFGLDINNDRLKILKKTGALIEHPALYSHLTGYENLNISCRMTSTPSSRINEVLQLVDMLDASHQKVAQYSMGMKQRLGIATALLPDPCLLILDEPTNGLDPAGITSMRQLIRHLNKDHGKTFFISSHLLHEVELTCSHLAIINSGRVIFQGTMAEANTRYVQHVHVETSDDDLAAKLLNGAYSFSKNNEHLEVVINTKNDIAAIGRLLQTHHLDIFRLEPRQQSLETLFLDLTKRQ